jgi:hypothetical protein
LGCKIAQLALVPLLTCAVLLFVAVARLLILRDKVGRILVYHVQATDGRRFRVPGTVLGVDRFGDLLTGTGSAMRSHGRGRGKGPGDWRA